MDVKALYFGCVGVIGHYLHVPSERGAVQPHGVTSRELAWSSCCDGTLLKSVKNQEEGRAVWSHVRGYSIVSFWDRTIDSRNGSSSSFLVKGMHTFSEVLIAAAFAFPDIFERFTFEIRGD